MHNLFTLPLFSVESQTERHKTDARKLSEKALDCLNEVNSRPVTPAMDLLSKKCIPCEGGTKPFAPEDIQPYLNQVKGWNLVRAEKF